jgi:UDP-N-acetylglucosamine pyrophosphorylase
VEYSDITKEQAEAKDGAGEYLFRWGSLAMHGFRTDFLIEANREGVGLPFHRAWKDVRAWNGREVAPTKGFKREKFIFDLMGVARRHVGLEVDRAEEFAPIKNDDRDGFDCRKTAQAMVTALHKRWLQALGVDIGQAGVVEISPLFAANFEQLKERWDGRITKVVGDLHLKR